MIKKLLWILWVFNVTAYAEPLPIVAAENFYGEMAEQLGGSYVKVTSVIKNPQQDPHLFSITPQTAKAVANAKIIIYNGMGYDPWMENLITTNTQQPQVIVVATLMGRHLGDNPHIWYNPNTLFVYSQQLTALLSEMDPIHQNYYQQQFNLLKLQQQKLLKKISELRNKYQGAPVIATEPVFNEMADAIGLVMHGKDLQLSIMNDTTPSFKASKDFEDQLNQHRVKVLIYNNQVSNPLTQHLQAIAKQAGIPIVGVSETQPRHTDYFTWMNDQLKSLAQALATGQSS